MAKGRKAISDEQKRLRGTDQPCRLREPAGTVSESVTLLTPPTLSSLPKPGLKGTAKKVYTLVATELLNRGVLDPLSSDLIVAYCREMALYHDMMRDLEREGVSKVSLIAFKSNEIGNQFWHRFGWKERSDVNVYDFVLNDENITRFNA